MTYHEDRARELRRRSGGGLAELGEGETAGSCRRRMVLIRGLSIAASDFLMSAVPESSSQNFFRDVGKKPLSSIPDGAVAKITSDWRQSGRFIELLETGTDPLGLIPTLRPSSDGTFHP